mgnify:FL=1
MNELPLFSDFSFRLPDLKQRQIVFPNGVSLACFPDKDSEVVRLEFIFANAGSNNQKKYFTAAAAANLLTEGSGDMSAAMMADKLDYYAAYVEKSTDRESTSVAFYFLKKYSAQIMPLVELIIKQPLYAEKEFDIYKNKQRQSVELNSRKTNMIAYKKFYQLLFPAENPLSGFGKASDFDLLSRNDVREFYDEFYSSKECEISLAGNFSDELLKTVEQNFGSNDWGKGKVHSMQEEPVTALPQVETAFVHKDKAVQASLRAGNVCISHKDKDFMPFKVLVALFGGYFGSRLMTNIREEKGYTYSIGSYVTTYRNCAVLSTLADVKAEKAKETFKEIDKEIEKLQNERVEEKELCVLKNYLLGECLRGLDGVFDMAEKFSVLRRSGYSLSYFDDMQKAIVETKPEDIRVLAQKYLRAEEMSRVLVCDKKFIE